MNLVTPKAGAKLMVNKMASGQCLIEPNTAAYYAMFDRAKYTSVLRQTIENGQKSFITLNSGLETSLDGRSSRGLNQ